MFNGPGQCDALVQGSLRVSEFAPTELFEADQIHDVGLPFGTLRALGHGKCLRGALGRLVEPMGIEERLREGSQPRELRGGVIVRTSQLHHPGGVLCSLREATQCEPRGTPLLVDDGFRFGLSLGVKTVHQ